MAGFTGFSQYTLVDRIGKMTRFKANAAQCARGGILKRRGNMAWFAPTIEEVTCGMEINMYFPAEGEDDLF